MYWCIVATQIESKDDISSDIDHNQKPERNACLWMNCRKITEATNTTTTPATTKTLPISHSYYTKHIELAYWKYQSNKQKKKIQTNWTEHETENFVSKWEVAVLEWGLMIENDSCQYGKSTWNISVSRSCSRLRRLFFSFASLRPL